MSIAASFNPATAEAEANTRLRNHIARSAGQHRRAIARSFAEARDQLESRSRHHLALVHSKTAELRAHDRKHLHPSNLPLAEHVWHLEDIGAHE